MLLFIKTGFANTILLNINLYIKEVSSLSYLFFDFSPVKSLEKTNSLEREHKITCFTFGNNAFHENTVRCTVGERCTFGVLKEKRRSEKYGALKVLFPDIRKITNRLQNEQGVLLQYSF